MSPSATPATKRSNAAIETSKNDPFCRTYHGHGHTAITRTVANGCGRLRTVRQRGANTPSTPNPQSETGTLATHSGKSAKVAKQIRGNPNEQLRLKTQITRTRQGTFGVSVSKPQRHSAYSGLLWTTQHYSIQYRHASTASLTELLRNHVRIEVHRSLAVS